jgi:hypothetical protein
MANLNFNVPSGNATGSVPAHTHAINEVSGLAEELTKLETDSEATKQQAAAAQQQAGEAMAAIPKLEAGTNVTFTTNQTTGATVINSLGGDMQTYTINGQPAVDGNFVLTPEGLGAADETHQHVIADVLGLQEALNEKSPKDHPHQMVSGVTIGAATLTGDVALLAGSNVQLIKTGNQITIAVDPVIAGTAVAVENLATADGTPVKSFIGTEAQWAALTKDAGAQYLVYIVGE